LPKSRETLLVDPDQHRHGGSGRRCTAGHHQVVKEQVGLLQECGLEDRQHRHRKGQAEPGHIEEQLALPKAAELFL
jgi:hypothetical protein